jgi:hypothetical protein
MLQVSAVTLSETAIVTVTAVTAVSASGCTCTNVVAVFTYSSFLVR